MTKYHSQPGDLMPGRFEDLQFPFYIFDLDGTLALNGHRDCLLPSVNNGSWEDYFKACVDDVPNIPVISIFRTLVHVYGMTGRVQIWTGRGGIVRKETMQWLDRNIPGYGEWFFDRITKMRPEGDFRKDEHLKLKWLNQLNLEGQKQLIGVFDDRDNVVKMWRANGVCCFQVAPGQF